MTDLCRAPTAKSNRSRRSGSELETVSRLYSGQFLDDASVYLSDDELEERAEEEDQEGQEEREERRQQRRPPLQRRKHDNNEDGQEKEAIENEESTERSSVESGIEADLEKGEALEKPQAREQRRGEPPGDPKLICFTGPDDPENPKNWPMRKKWAATVVVSCFTFMSPMSSSMVAPSVQAIAEQFHITDQVEMEMTMSIFILAYAIGPLFLGPMSEIYGRVIILQLANLFYLAFNIACGVCQSKGQMIAFRFLSGLGGSAPLAVRCPWYFKYRYIQRAD